MIKRLVILLILVGVCLLAAVVLPLVIAAPPIANLAPVSELADADSRFVTVDGISVHYKVYGSGQPVVILLHGLNSSTFTWRELVGPLSQHATVIAYDRPGFGLTARPLPGPSGWNGLSPYGAEANVRLLFDLMDAWKVDKAVLMGNSEGGTLAVQAALAKPERVSALVLADAAVYPATTGTRFGLLAPLVNTPQMERIGPYLVRSIAGDQGKQFWQAAWHDPSKITAEISAGYNKPLRMENWDIGLWEYTKVGTGNENLPARLGSLRLPVLVLTGDDDQYIPAEMSQRLAAGIPGAQEKVLPACGHLPQEECPAAFLSAASAFLQKLP